MSDLKILLGLGVKLFPVNAKHKTPIIEGWQQKATSDLKQLKRWAKRFPGCGWGVACGPSGLHVIDIDGAHGELSVLDKDLPSTLEVETQSSNRHLYYKGSTASKNRALRGLDIKSVGGFVVAAGSMGYRIIGNHPIADAPTWSIKLAGQPSRKERPTIILSEDDQSDIKRAQRWLDQQAPASIEGEGGNDNAFKVACRVKDFGVSDAMCLDLMLGKWNERCEPPWDFSELSKIVENAYQYAVGDQGELSAAEDFDELPPSEKELEAKRKKEERPPLIDRMNARHAKMPFGGKMVIWVEETNSDGTTDYKPYSTQEFDKLYEHRNVPVKDANGEVKFVPLGKWWRLNNKHMRCDRIVLDPTLPPGPTEMNGPFNLWRGWKIQPVEGDWSDYKKLIHEALCAGIKNHTTYVLNWIAFLLQKPMALHKIAIVFRGKKGTGKSTLGLALKMIFGHHATKADTAQAVVGRFNWHLRDKVFLLAEEVRWMQDRGGEGILKALITDPERNYEAKGLNAVNGTNHISVMITTNDDWAVPASSDERRFDVFDVSDCLIGDRALWGRLYKSDGTLRHEPIAAFMFAMLKRDISGFDPRNDAPKTEALVEQAFESMDYIDRWWFDRLSTGQPPGTSEESWYRNDLMITIADGYDDFMMTVPRGRHIPSKLTVGRRLAIYGVNRKRVRGDNGLQYVWHVPILEEARELFEKIFGKKLDW